MNKSQLIELIAKNNDMPKTTAKRVVESLVATITQSLSEGDLVQLPGFGSFSLSYHPEKQGRNPQTGEEITIAGQNKVAFKAGSKLKSAINE
ncbi:MAG: HU family DNA-binding protein [Pseudoalteromonas spongiae]|uniref:HU family DNA-binding protein n=1 Tax=Pseudoalteromonas spongiae TaxID=298657 RepID=UPI00026C908A|nr:HU family DNA-binding protein [Pseudoalteromonas spongiae]ATD00990.1 DNA-binding protein HU-alpha [Pseudoalteromonas spongiae UST010723-006]